MRLGLVKHRIGEQIPVGELQRLARSGHTLNRAAQVLGVNWSTVFRIAQRHRIDFPRHYHGYGWRGVERT